MSSSCPRWSPICRPPRTTRSVWILGNSQTYTVASRTPGVPLEDRAAGIAIDELAACVDREYPETHANFYLLAYPNFLPFEMLTRVGHLLASRSSTQGGLSGAHLAQHRPRFAIAARSLSGLSRHRRLPTVSRRCSPIRACAGRSSGDRRDRRPANPGRARSSSSNACGPTPTGSTNCSRAGSATADADGQAARTCGPRSFALATNRVQQLWYDRKSVEFSYDLGAARSGFQHRSVCGP